MDTPANLKKRARINFGDISGPTTVTESPTVPTPPSPQVQPKPQEKPSPREPENWETHIFIPEVGQLDLADCTNEEFAQWVDIICPGALLPNSKAAEALSDLTIRARIFMQVVQAHMNVFFYGPQKRNAVGLA